MSGLHRHTLSFPGRLSGVTSTACALQSAPPAPMERRQEAPTPPANDQALAKLHAALTAAVDAAKAVQAKTRDELTRTAASLAVEIAQRLLQNEIAQDRQRLDRIVYKLLAQLPSSRAAVLRGHPDDLTLLQKQFEEHGTMTTPDELSFRPDAAMERGTLKMESDDCFLDWNTPHALAELKSLLLEDTHEAD